MTDRESAGEGSDGRVKSRLREEIIKYLVVSAWLFVCFGVLQMYQSAVLQDAGVHYLPLCVAAVKALIIGKFLLIGDAVRARLQRPPGRLPASIATRVVWLLVILALLTVAEELVVGWIHGLSIADVQTELRARSMLERVAEVLLMGLILNPLVATGKCTRPSAPGCREASSVNLLTTAARPRMTQATATMEPLDPRPGPSGPIGPKPHPA